MNAYEEVFLSKYNDNVPLIDRALYVHRPRMCLIARASVNQGVVISSGYVRL